MTSEGAAGEPAKRVAALATAVVVLLATLSLPVAAGATTAAGNVTIEVEVSDRVNPGQDVTATITVYNDGATAVAENVVVRLAGEEIDSKRVLVPAGGNETVTTEFEAPRDSGTYRLSVDGTHDLTAATLLVADESAPRLVASGPREVVANGTATVEFTATVFNTTERLALEADLTNASGATIREASVEGNGSIGSRLVRNGTVIVTATGLGPESTLHATVEAGVPADVADLDVVATATTPGGDDRWTLTIPVVQPVNDSERSRYRTVTRPVEPGGNATVTTTVPTDGRRLKVVETVEGAASVAVTDVRVENAGAYHDDFDVENGSVVVKVGGQLRENTTVTVEYKVYVPENATGDDRIRISGNATRGFGFPDAEEVNLNVSTIRIEEVQTSPLAPYANDEGRVDTDGLRLAIEDWAGGDIDTSLLQQVIQAWASGEVVA